MIISKNIDQKHTIYKNIDNFICYFVEFDIRDKNSMHYEEFIILQNVFEVSVNL